MENLPPSHNGVVMLERINAEGTNAEFYSFALSTPEGRRFMWEATPSDIAGITAFLKGFRENPDGLYYFISVERLLPESAWLDIKFSMPMSGGAASAELITTQKLFLGHIGLRKDKIGNPNVYWLSYYNANLGLRGRGYIGQAVQLLLSNLPQDIEICARVSHENLPSIAILDHTMSYDHSDEKYHYYARKQPSPTPSKATPLPA